MAKSVTSGSNRRTFLKSVGSLILASGVPVTWAMDEKNPARQQIERIPALPPSVGALYNPYYRAEDWNFLAGRRPEVMPLLGSYQSEIGSMSTHMVWAKNGGLSYFVAPLRADIPDWRNRLHMLFSAARQQTFRVALCLDGEEPGVGSASDTFLSKIVDEPAYLRTPDRQPVLFSIGLRPQTIIRWDGVRVDLPSSWRQRGINARKQRQAKEIGTYFGVSLTSEKPAFKQMESIPDRFNRRYSFAFVMPASQTGAENINLSLPAPDMVCGFDYVVVDSFNNWGYSLPLEPSTRFGKMYIGEIREWIDRVTEAA